MSDKPCENGCMTPLRFPRRPGTEIGAPHGPGCPCCSSEQMVSGDNRPSLPHFNYRIGTYGSIREWLFHQINQTPNLQAWTYRGPDDPAVALLEGASILGDILTFYQETYANEAFLRTAQWRESISDLVRLLGYRLSPAVGGSATFAFEIRKDEAVTIPVGFPLKAELQPIVKPADFETTEEITAYPWLSKFSLYRPLVGHDITPATTEFYISNPQQLIHPIAIKPGDRLMIGESNTSGLAQPLQLDHAEIVLIDSVRELHGTKIYGIKGKMKRKTNSPSLIAYKIGRTFHHFGHNSPYEIVDDSKPVTSSSEIEGTTTSTSATIPKLQVPRYRPVKDTLVSKAVDTRFGPLEFPLDSEVRDIPNNIPVIIQAGFIYQKVFPAQWYRPPHKTLVRTILDQKSITAKWGGISGTVTQLDLKELLSQSLDKDDEGLIRQAEKEAAEADAAAAKAFADLTEAKNAAKSKMTALSAAKKAATLADADLADKNSKSLAAAADAATLAVAQQTAAAALKDDATDAAAQAALTSAIAALDAARIAKTDADRASGDAVASATSATRSKNDAETAANIFLLATVVDPAAAGAARAVYDAAKLNFTKSAADLTKTDAETSARSADTTVSKLELAKNAADGVKAAAAANADAKRRYDDAKLAADNALGAAGLAKTAADNAKTAALAAYDATDAAELALANANDLVASMKAVHEQALNLVEVKNQAKLVRMYIGDALFHEVLSPVFRIKRAMTETAEASGDTLNFYGTADQVKDLKDRRIMLQYPAAEAMINTVTSVPAFFDLETYDFPQLYPITLSSSVDYADFPNEGPAVKVYGNLVDADEGKTQPEVAIGSGDATQVFQNFKLPKAPLTYHIVPGNTPSETPEADIYVDGRKWEKVDSFFGRGKDERIYIIRESADSTSWVQFGDGKSGARLPNGVNNVTAVYRIGDGAYGELKPDTKVQASAKLKNLDKVQMPLAATGGALAEDGENARNAAPGKVQSLGRIVSLADFEVEAAAIPGVAKAAARWQLRDNVPMVVVTVLMETGRSFEISTVADTLSSYNMLRGAGRDPVSTDEGKRFYVTAAVKYALRSGYRADLVEPEIRLALGVNHAKTEHEENQTGLFSMRRRKFGAAEYASSVEGVVQNVDGVLWAETVVFQKLTDSDDPAAIVMPAVSACETTITCGAGHILSLYDKHLFLTVAAEGAG